MIARREIKLGDLCVFELETWSNTSQGPAIIEPGTIALCVAASRSVYTQPYVTLLTHMGMLDVFQHGSKRLKLTIVSDNA